MKFYDNGQYEDYTRIVAISQNSRGNEVIGDMWVDTNLFDKNAPISDVIQWAKENGTSGKLIITICEPPKRPIQF